MLFDTGSWDTPISSDKLSAKLFAPLPTSGSGKKGKKKAGKKRKSEESPGQKVDNSPKKKKKKEGKVEKKHDSKNVGNVKSMQNGAESGVIVDVVKKKKRNANRNKQKQKRTVS